MLSAETLGSIFTIFNIIITHHTWVRFDHQERDKKIETYQLSEIFGGVGGGGWMVKMPIIEAVRPLKTPPPYTHV